MYFSQTDQAKTSISSVPIAEGNMNCDCPSCGSRNTKALKIIHQNGVRIYRSDNQGWFYYRGRFGVKSSNTKGRSQSLAAQNSAPPVSITTAFLQSPIPIIGLVLGAIFWGAIGFFLLLIIMIVLALVFGYLEAEEHNLEVKYWENTYLCGRCGNEFTVLDDAL